MFRDKRKDTSAQKVETILGKDTAIKGEIKSKGSLRIEGEVQGNMEVEGNVFIGRDGRVEADIVSDSIVVAGSVQADIKCKGKLKILAQGKVVGDIEVSQLVIDEGGSFIGHSRRYEDVSKDKGVSSIPDKDTKDSSSGKVKKGDKSGSSSSKKN